MSAHLISLRENNNIKQNLTCPKRTETFKPDVWTRCKPTAHLHLVIVGGQFVQGYVFRPIRLGMPIKFWNLFYRPTFKFQHF